MLYPDFMALPLGLRRQVQRAVVRHTSPASRSPQQFCAPLLECLISNLFGMNARFLGAHAPMLWVVKGLGHAKTQNVWPSSTKTPPGDHRGGDDCGPDAEARVQSSPGPTGVI